MRVLAALVLLAASSSAAEPQEPLWTRHVIDDSSRGADGIKLGDVNADGRLDIVTPWEEGGVVRVYINPGSHQVRNRWPAVTVGRVGHPEDAVFADLDGDGTLQVVSCCEGDTRAIFIHRLTDPERLLDETAWETERIAAADGRQWMQCCPIEMGFGRTGLILGSKGEDAVVAGLFPSDASDVIEAWRFVPLAKAGWVMSIVPSERGRPSVLISDRKGSQRGLYLLRPSWTNWDDWTRIDVCGSDREVMFAAESPSSYAVATRGGPVLEFVPEWRNAGPISLEERIQDGTTMAMPMPPGTGTGKAVAIADLNADGRRDIAVSCENANGEIGVFWLEQSSRIDMKDDAGRWQFHDISGLEGTKFDRIELLDLDGDGDLDLLTCEEFEGLGVVWYENPLK